MWYFLVYRRRLLSPRVVSLESDRSGEGVEGEMLSDPECRVLTVHCFDHAVARCEDCRRDYKFTELGIEIRGRRYYFCPSCRLDLVDQLRMHVLHCQGIASALEERIQRSQQLMKETDRLRTAAAILAAESHALAERVLQTLRSRHPLVKRVPRTVPAPDFHRVLLVLLEVYGPLCKPCLAHQARMSPSKVAVALNHLRQTIALRVEHRDCPACNHITQIFSLAKTHEDADGQS